MGQTSLYLITDPTVRSIDKSSIFLCLDAGLGLISDEIREGLGIDVSVLMGANIANEVARDQFCESTVGGFGQNAKDFKDLFQRPTFR